MSDVAIKVEGLGKKYIIGHQKEGDLRGSFGQKIKKLLGSNHGQTHEEFWALKDISFEVKKGEAVGIIGRNGAGKSTLLKILSRITDPSTGRFEMNGRVSSLLEVGTGFHSELSGRENIYLNGTILGMKRREIKAKFDEIVAFSGVEKFIDTPVKHYSSGMKVRLAFSVAAHLEPEILIVDEVLAVGDAEFQKKCLGKMDEVSKNEGRTILFVSHNMGAVKNLCTSSILVENGEIAHYDATPLVIENYLSFANVSTGKWIFDKPITNTPGFINAVSLKWQDKQLSKIPSHTSFSFNIQFTLVEPIKHFILGLGMTSLDDTPIRTVWSEPKDLQEGIYNAVLTENTIFFAPGKYKIIIGLSASMETFQYMPEPVILEIDDTGQQGRLNLRNSGLVINQMNITISENELARVHQ